LWMWAVSIEAHWLCVHTLARACLLAPPRVLRCRAWAAAAFVSALVSLPTPNDVLLHVPPPRPPHAWAWTADDGSLRNYPYDVSEQLE
jgi:hypothetical protein